MNATPPDADAFTPDHAWSHLRDVLGMVITLFGLPAQIVASVALPRRMRADMLAWLTACETLARRMLLIAAAALPKPNAPAPGKAQRLNMDATHGRAGFANEDSAKWSVSFHVLPAAQKPKPAWNEADDWNAQPQQKRKPTLAINQRIDTRPLAERLEALIRVAADPEAYARRLAHRLYAQPARAARLLKAQRSRFRVSPVAAMMAEAKPLAERAALIFANSS